MFSGVAKLPRMASAGSPGIIAMIRKTITEMPSRTGTMATFVKYALPEGSASTAHAVMTPYGQDRRNLDALLATT